MYASQWKFSFSTVDFETFFLVKIYLCYSNSIAASI